MRTFSAAVVFSVLAGFSNTQTIDPSTVDLATRENWCLNQQTSCPLLCLQFPGQSSTTISNDCDAETLDYSCVCENGLSPNASEYSQTIPFYECSEWGTQCVAACGTNTCADACRSEHPCGAQNPVRVNTSTISTMSATATDGSASTSTGATSVQYTGFGGSAATTTAASSKKSAAGSVMLELGSAYGLAVIVVGFFGGFALVL